MGSGSPLQPKPVVSPEQKTSKSPAQGVKRVRVLLPDEGAEELSPLELPRRPGSFRPQMKPILRRPREQFLEDPPFLRDGVASLHQSGKAIPKGARWTKINSRLVCAETLELANERYEPREDFVIVLRVLTKEEIEQYATFTHEIRNNRALATLSRRRG